MAAIRETLTLEDKFSAVFTQYINLGEKAAGASTRASQASQNYQTVLSGLDQRLILLNAQFSVGINKQQAMADAGQQNTAEFTALDARMKTLGSTIRDLTAQYEAISTQAEEAAQEAKKFADSNKQATHSANNLASSLGRLLGAYVGLQSIKGIFILSDTLSQTTARLDLMNDGLQTTAELNDMIFASAQRSRGAYQDTADMVSKLGMLAGEAFNSSQEIVAFAEQINKQMTLSGASTTGAQAAMLQLTQAMSSGVLRGEELNSILEQTPTIAQSIAAYLGVSTGVMREMASEGQITAEVIKNAMFAAADETNAKFESMPMTWSQVWTQAQNVIVQTLEPVLGLVSQLANFIGEHMDTAIAAFYGLAAAVAFYSVAQWIATGAAKAFFVALMSNPVLLAIAVAIGIVVYAIYKWIQSVGGLKAAWLITVDAILYWWDLMKIGFQVGVYAVMNWLDNMSLKFQKISVNIQNWIGNMKVGVLNILQNMVNGAIDIINWFIDKLNKIPGVAITPIEHVTFAATAAAAEEAATAAREASLAAAEQEVLARQAERAQIIADMLQEREANHAARQAEIEKVRAEAAAGADNALLSAAAPYSPQLDDISSSVAGIEKSIDMTQEDLESLIDVAERRYVNQINLTSQTPVINVSGQNTGRTQADRTALAEAIQRILVEQISSSSVRSTARAF